MTSLDPCELSKDLLIDRLYRGQVDLKILEMQLAREREPYLPLALLYALSALHVQLNELTPTARH